MNTPLLITGKEAGEIFRSPRGLAWLLAVAAALSIFSLLLVSNTELSLLDNAQVVYDMTSLATFLGSLLAVIVGVVSVAGERERGSLLPLLLAPVSRGDILLGKLGGLAVTWAAMFLLSLPYLWAVGSTGQNLADGTLILALLGSPVVFGFGCLALGLGARLGSVRAGLMAGLVVLLVAASPIVLGPSLRQTAIGAAFDAVNPFAAAVNAYDEVIIDSASLVAQWGRGLVVLSWLALAGWFARNGLRSLVREGGGL